MCLDYVIHNVMLFIFFLTLFIGATWKCSNMYDYFCLVHHCIFQDSAVIDSYSFDKANTDWVCLLLSIVQLYRLERYSECKSVYTDLIRNSQDEYEEERKTNLAAVVAAMSQWESTPLVSAPKISFLHVVCLRPFL